MCAAAAATADDYFPQFLLMADDTGAVPGDVAEQSCLNIVGTDLGMRNITVQPLTRLLASNRSFTAAQSYPLRAIAANSSHVSLINVTVTAFGGTSGAPSPHHPPIPVSQGGAIHLIDGSLHIETSKFTSCWATTGGVIYAIDAIVIVNNSLFQNNGAEVAGGSMFLEQLSFEAYASVFVDNVVTVATDTLKARPSAWQGQGGAVFGFAVSAYLNEVTLHRNRVLAAVSVASFQGGAFSATYSTIALNKVTAVNNSAVEGGAFSMVSSAWDASNSEFIFNEGHNGGAIKADGCEEVTLSDCRFADNRAAEVGGAMAVSFQIQRMTLTDCTFINNAANGLGGGAMSLEHSATVALLETFECVHCSFLHNSANSGGGGALLFIGLTVPPSMPAAQQVLDLKAENNTAGYGDLLATEGRSLVSFDGKNLTFSAMQQMRVTIAVVDGFGSVVATVASTPVRLSIAPTATLEGQMPCDCPVSLEGATTATIAGVAVISGERPLVAPGCCAHVQATSGQLEPWGFQVAQTACRPGTAVSADLFSCVPCPAGRYSSNYNADTCSPCAAGTFGADEGISKCTLCDAGTFSAGGKWGSGSKGTTMQMLNALFAVFASGLEMADRRYGL